MNDVFLPLRLDARGGAVLSSRCCGFLAETANLADAEFVRECLRLRLRTSGVCPLCGASRPETEGE